MRFTLLCCLFFISLLAHAQTQTVQIGIPSFVPPYVMQGANNKVFGFDVDMMRTICARINRTCQFKIIDFDKLIDSVSTNDVDLAVGAISITSERAKKVLFSSPYLPTFAQFLSRRNQATADFQLKDLAGKRIGVEKGSVFDREISLLGIKNPTVIPYQYEEDMIEALHHNKIDFVLLDEPTALYWQNYSSGLFRAVGRTFKYGSGLGIAVNPNQTNLLNEINQALVNYHKSPAFKKHYRLYLERF